MLCDNKNSVHDNQVINETEGGIRVICKKCKQINILRKDPDRRFNNRQYAKVFKKDLLQVGENLYYKEHPHNMSIV